MNSLKEILNQKKLSDRLNKIIISLYEQVIKFWGEDKEQLILQTIKSFEIMCINDLSNEIDHKYNGKIDKAGIGKNNIGLCMVIPISKDGLIVNTRNVILLDNKKSDEELSSILSHELFFHGVKSMIQPYISQNILMMGLDAQKFHYNDNNQVILIENSNGHGLEEISTYYGQNRIMKAIFEKNIKIDKLLLEICNSFGDILMKTTLGKIILEAQITKSVDDLIDKFNATEDNRLMLMKSNNRITWDDYNNLMDSFMSLCSSINAMDVSDKDYNKKLDEYIRVYQQLSDLNMQILFAAVLLDSYEIEKKHR